MKKKSFINDRQDISSGTKKNFICWYCKLHGKNILDEHGCCKRCGTNITKLTKMRDKPYPIELLDHKLLEDNVLGDRKKFTLPEDEGEY